MRDLLPYPVKGGLSFLLYVINTLFWASLLFCAALLKLLIPLSGWRRVCDVALNWIAGCWITGNNLNQSFINTTTWDIQGLDTLSPDRWYLVVCNHQSWVDILVLQRVFHGHIPFLKFFLKKELIWVPVLGLAWWALEFPFMKRYSKAYLKRYPHKQGKDIEITRKACRRFRTLPTSVMNFVEGTRFTADKHRRQDSPYRHLLRPKSGGIAFVLAAMGEQLTGILDVTIVYPGGAGSFWEFISGRVPEVVVRIETLPVTAELMGDYFSDPDFRSDFQDWVNRLWQRKDLLIDTLSRETVG
jgi:1-acyl-sn-glycerol-3-phosphate acyltransferase